MNKQQLATLEATLREGTTLHDEYTPTLPSGAAHGRGAPYEYAIDWYGAKGQYLLDLTLWSDYYRYHSTREQPGEEGWATQENIAVWSPYLSELFQELEDRGIPLPSPTLTDSRGQWPMPPDATWSAWGKVCPGVHARIRGPLPYPAQQVNTAAIARGTAPTMDVKCKGCGIDMVVPRQPVHDWWCPICALKPDA